MELSTTSKVTLIGSYYGGKNEIHERLMKSSDFRLKIKDLKVDKNE